jgi:hypothetical protein
MMFWLFPKQTTKSHPFSALVPGLWLGVVRHSGTTRVASL